jgi:hypothetical protein
MTNFLCEQQLDCGEPCLRLFGHKGPHNCEGPGEPVFSSTAEVIELLEDENLEPVKEDR